MVQARYPARLIRTAGSGVTDPSFPPSSSSAAQLRAIEALRRTPSAHVAHAGVAFHYGAGPGLQPGEIMFATNNRASVVSRLVGVE